MATELAQLLGITLTVVGMTAEVIGTAAGVYYPLRKRIPLTPLDLVGLGGSSFFCGLVIWAAVAFAA